jgi:hypothetical protein
VGHYDDFVFKGIVGMKLRGVPLEALSQNGFLLNFTFGLKFFTEFFINDFKEGVLG